MTMRLTVCLLPIAFRAAAQDGRQVFSHCQVCHGDGRGTERGPNLVNNH